MFLSAFRLRPTERFNVCCSAVKLLESCLNWKTLGKHLRIIGMLYLVPTGMSKVRNCGAFDIFFYLNDR